LKAALSDFKWAPAKIWSGGGKTGFGNSRESYPGGKTRAGWGGGENYSIEISGPGPYGSRIPYEKHPGWDGERSVGGKGLLGKKQKAGKGTTKKVGFNKPEGHKVGKRISSSTSGSSPEGGPRTPKPSPRVSGGFWRGPSGGPRGPRSPPTGTNRAGGPH